VVGGGSRKNFLEKIIHVPLHLPPAETIELRKMALEGVDAALFQQEIVYLAKMSRNLRGRS